MQGNVMSVQVFHLPPANRYFAGRAAALAKIQNHFQEKAEQKVLVLTGAAGMGKTQLAKHIAHTQAASYDLVAWFNVNETLASQITALAEWLDLCWGKETPHIPPHHLDPPMLWQRIQQRLLKKGWRCLCVFDGVTAYDALLPYTTLIPGLQIQLLLTSRFKITAFPTLSVGAFLANDAKNFLQKTLPHPSSESLLQLSESLGRHPLALSLAAGFLRFTPGSTVSAYLAQHTQNPSHPHPTVFADRYPQTLDTAVGLSLDALQKAFPPAFELFTVLAQLFHGAIPLAFVHRAFKKTPAVVEALRTLNDSSLVETQVMEGAPHLLLHPLIHQIVCKHMHPAASKRLLEKAIHSLLPFFQGPSHVLSAQTLLNPTLLLHAQHLSARAQTLGWQSIPLLSLRIRLLHGLHSGPRDFDQARMLITRIKADLARFDPPFSFGALDFPDGAFLAPFTPRLGEEDLILWETDLGFFAAALDRDWTQSLDHGERALALLEKHSCNGSEKLRVHANLLQVQTLTGQLKEAQKTIEHIIPLLKGCTSPLRRMGAVLAWAECLRIQGQGKKALTLLQKHAKLLDALPHHPASTLMFLRIKGEILAREMLDPIPDQARLCNATLAQLERALKDFYGGRLPPALATCWVLQVGNSLRNAGEKDGGFLLSRLNQALRIYADAWPGPATHPLQAFAYFVVGKGYTQTGAFDAALLAYRRAEEIYKQVLHSLKVEDVSALYGGMVQLGRLRGDADLAYEALAKHVGLFGLAHPRTRALCEGVT
jgi:tetratricopeptide (TPR) repeat protein